MDNNVNNLSNNGNNESNANNINQEVVITSTPKIEVAPIQNGVVQDVVTTGDQIVPTEVVKKDKKWFILAIIIVVVVVLLALSIFITFAVRVGKNEIQIGTVKNNFLIYENPLKDQKIEFDITDNLAILVTITNVDVDEDIGTEVTYSLSVKNGKDIVENRTVWENANNEIQINFQSVGDNAIFKSGDLNDNNGIILDVFSSDLSLTELSGFGTNDVYFITDYSVSDKKLNLYLSRVKDFTKIIYDVSDLKDKEVKEELSDGLSICNDEVTYVDGSINATETYSFSLKNGILDFDNPIISDEVSLNSYVSSYKDVYCQ